MTMTCSRVLVVEDDNIIAKDIRRTLERLGYTVPGIASTGEDAIRKAMESRPHLVLMDIVLKGGMDGVEAAERIRTRLRLPVVYLTAHADDDTLRRAKLTEPFGYILKPFEERDLHTTIEMAFHKHAMEMELRESQQWLATTLKSVGDAVIATDPHGHVTFMNPLAEKITNWKQEEAIGRPLTEVFQVINEDTRAAVESPVETVLREGKVVALANHSVVVARSARGKSGAETPIDDSAAPIRDDDGTLHGTVLVFHDITERRRAEHELQEANRRLEKALDDLRAANRVKDTFLAMVSHELRTPLTSMMGWIHLLQAGTLDPAAHKRALASIDRQASAQSRLIGDLLDLSQLSIGRLQLAPETVDLALIVKDAVANARLAAESKTIRLHCETEATPCWVEADPDRVQQIVWNLLLNAVKFTPNNGRVQVCLRREDDHAHLIVADTGKGIQPSFLPHVFEPFSQERQAKPHGGLGLGLVIVRHLVELHGGTVQAHSEGERRGATFTVKLPLTASPENNRRSARKR